MARLTNISTMSDKTVDEWAANDDVVRLRDWATETIRPLPRPPMDECTVGAAETCGIRIDDRSGRVSRLHARLVRDQGKWLLRDEGSKNGIWLDGSRRREIALEPGAEIGIGGITLVAESKLSIALRSFLARLVGWGKGRTEIVDLALRSVRMASTRRAALILCGSAPPTPDGVTLHSPSHNIPAKSPSAAKSRHGCGPESPIGMGRGGSSRAAAKKAASQRAGLFTVHQASGSSAAGAASTALVVRVGATAIAAAHAPNRTGARK